MLLLACGSTHPVKVEPNAGVPDPVDQRRLVASADFLVEKVPHEMERPNRGTEEVNSFVGEVLSWEAVQ